MNTLGLTSACFCLLAFSPAPNATNPEKDIVATASAAGTFQTLLTAAKTAGLAGVLQSEGPFTVFAPTDEAFGKLPKGTIESLLDPANRAILTTILKFHVVAGKADAATALRAGTVKTLAGENVKIALSKGRLRVQDANVIENDVETANGIIHIIDKVLLPPMTKTTAPIELGPKSLIETAINRGVPLFNHGQRAACAAIYEVTVRSLLQMRSVSTQDREKLATALRKSAAESSSDAAWTLRRALDAVHKSLEDAERKENMDEAKGQNGNGANGSSCSDAQECSEDSDIAAVPMSTIFDFKVAGEVEQFRSLNDTVMGGRSSSRMETGDGTAVFSGTTSLENRGGFASVRAPIQRGSLAGANSITMRVRGDGRVYRLTVQKNRAMWDVEFPTTAGKWIEVDVPMAKLRRNIRGYRPNTNPPKPEDVTGIGVLIGDKKAGPFRLEIDWIRKQI